MHFTVETFVRIEFLNLMLSHTFICFLITIYEVLLKLESLFSLSIYELIPVPS